MMANNQTPNRSETPDQEEQPFDHAITALLFICSGSYLSLLGGTMTGLAYTYEDRPNHTSLTEHYNLNTKVAGPVLLAIGGACLIVALVLISVFKVCAPKDWSNRKMTSTVSPLPNSVTGISTISGNEYSTVTRM